MRSVVFILAVLSAPALAQFKCTDAEGKVTFQQTPCVNNQQQQKLTIRAAAPTPAPPPPSVPAAGEGGTVEQRMLRGLERERRVREIEQQIVGIETAMQRRGGAMEAEMAALRNRKAYANNSLAGATWEQSLSTEMQAVAAKHKTYNDIDLEQLKELRSELVKAKAAK